MRTIATMMMLVLMAGLFVACTGAPSTDDGAAAPTNDKASVEEKGAAAETPKGNSGSVADEFLGFMSGRANLEWKVAYDLSMTIDGKTTKSTMTEYMKTEKKIRFDTTYEGGESQMFMVNDVVTTCTKMNGKWSCFKITSPDEEKSSTPDSVKFEDSFEETPDNYVIVADGTKQVAGVTAKCFKVQDKVNAGVVRYCIKDNLPLYTYTEFEGTVSEMTATSYSKSVPDSAFVPPAEAKDLGEMMGGLGGASGGNGAGDACSVCGYLSGADKEDCLANC